MIDLIKEHNGFKIGDKVTVISTGGIFPHYEGMANALGAKNWQKEENVYNNMKVVIVNIGKGEGICVALIRNKKGGEYLIGANKSCLKKEYRRRGKVELTTIV